MTLAIAVAFSILIGVSLGLLGGGGSILTVPILVYILGMEAKAAIATSLLVVAITSGAATIPHARAGRVQLRTGLIFGASAMLGAFLAGRVAHYIPAGILLVAFAAMMLVTAVAMMRGRRVPAQANANGEFHLAPIKVLIEGLIVGGVTGLVGAGGGFLVVPALVLLGGLPMHVAVGTSLVVITMKSLAGFVGYLDHVQIDWTIAALVSGMAVIGSLVGSRLASKVPQETLRRGFAWFVVVMGVYILGRQLPEVLGVELSTSMMAAIATPVALLIVLGIVMQNRRIRGAQGRALEATGEQ